MAFASALAVATALGPSMLVAQDVTLRLISGSGSISGTVISQDEDTFIIDTVAGVMQISKERVTCEGDGCPTIQDNFLLEMASAGEEADVLLPTIAGGFAGKIDAEVVNMTDGGDMMLSIDDFDGEQLGTIQIRNAGDRSAFDLMLGGQASVVLTNNPPSQEMRAALIASGAGDLRTYEQERVIAVAGQAIATNPDNPISQISTAQVAGILAGNITNWADLGGEDATINVYALAFDDPSYEEFRSIVLRPLGVSLTSRANIVGTTTDVTRAIGNDPYGLGVVNYSKIRNLHALPVVNECGMTIEPSEFSIKTERYPFQNRIYVYNTQDVDGTTQEFLAHLDSEDLDGLVSKAGFIDQAVLPEEGAVSGNRVRQVLNVPDRDTVAFDILQDITVDLINSTRLSTTFRFEPGASALDVKARRDIARVITFLRENPQKTALIVGFADSGGAFGPNLDLSRVRASVVADEIRAGLPAWVRGSLVDIQVRAYGEIAPVACNENFDGRASNRRVEIWVQ